MTLLDRSHIHDTWCNRRLRYCKLSRYIHYNYLAVLQIYSVNRAWKLARWNYSLCWRVCRHTLVCYLELWLCLWWLSSYTGWSMNYNCTCVCESECVCRVHAYGMAWILLAYHYRQWPASSRPTWHDSTQIIQSVCHWYFQISMALNDV